MNFNLREKNHFKFYLKIFYLGKTQKIADISQQQNERIESKQREKIYEIRSLPHTPHIKNLSAILRVFPYHPNKQFSQISKSKSSFLHIFQIEKFFNENEVTRISSPFEEFLTKKILKISNS
jgi:hypothetical protein